MALKYFSWHHRLFKQLVTRMSGRAYGFCLSEPGAKRVSDDKSLSIFAHLPADILVDIFSRLPAEFIVEYCMCQGWESILEYCKVRSSQSLASSRYFAELHLKRSTSPVIFRHFGYDYKSGKEFSIIDEKSETKCIIKGMKNAELIGSCDGLVLLFTSHDRNLHVINPITHTRMTISAPSYYGCESCIFFHPLEREYRILHWGTRLVIPSRNYRERISYTYQYQFEVYETRAKIWRRINTCTFELKPFFRHSPAIINGALHWMGSYDDFGKYRGEKPFAPCTQAIIVFRMVDENLHARPHPGEECRSRESHLWMRLLVKDQSLSFCQVWLNLIDVWILQDYENWSWVRKYRVHLDMRVDEFPKSPVHPRYLFARLRLVSIQNEELCLAWPKRGLFFYHLVSNAIRRIDIMWRPNDANFVPLTKSLINLSNSD